MKCKKGNDIDPGRSNRGKIMKTFRNESTIIIITSRTM